jgi:bifunctional UDP-N-acetylglucosamine pyrophosphorylase/glucosamine-1-phosphate N-acetyltransferase
LFDQGIMDTWDGVVLAAGAGSRMRSKTPKPLHMLNGKPIAVYVLDAIDAVLGKQAIVVENEEFDLRQVFGLDRRYVLQSGPSGTGGAIQSAEPMIDVDVQNILVVNADNPFISIDSLNELISSHENNNSAVTLLSALVEDRQDLGVVMRDDTGRVKSVIEAHDRPDLSPPIHEVNCGAYCFDAKWLWDHISKLPRHDNGELYITDLIGVAEESIREVVSVLTKDPWEAWGINTRMDLALAEKQMRIRTIQGLMRDGVAIVDPDSTYIESTVIIGQDTVIRPNTHLQGRTQIGSDCEIGPGCQIKDSEIGDRCMIGSSVLEQTIIQDDVEIGPFCHLRAGSYLSSGVHVGNFGEIKNSRLGLNVQMGHFSYIGDADIGDNVNIGAGVITANFDGETKHRTTIHEDVFLGVHTMLIAPIDVGARSRTGAGTVLNKDTPADTMAIGVPAQFRELKPLGESEEKNAAGDQGLIKNNQDIGRQET